MKPGSPIKLVSELLDLPIVDADGRWCGVVDDVELSGGAGKDARIKSLLVGPGAYAGRMPRWCFWLVRKLAGDRMTRVPLEDVAEIGTAVKLDSRAAKLGLGRSDDRARAWVPHWGAM